MCLLTAPFVVIGVQLALEALRPGRLGAADRRAASAWGLHFDPSVAPTVAGIGALVVLLVCALTIGLAVGVFFRRDGAHHAAIGVFAMFAFTKLLVAGAGMLSNPPAPNAEWGLASTAADAFVLWLLCRPAMWDAMEDAEARRRHGFVLPPWR